MECRICFYISGMVHSRSKSLLFICFTAKLLLFYDKIR